MGSRQRLKRLGLSHLEKKPKELGEELDRRVKATKAKRESEAETTTLRAAGDLAQVVRVNRMTSVKLPQDNEARGQYYYASGSECVDEMYQGYKVVGRWIREDFRPVQFFWWTPKFSKTREHIAQLENGQFAVRRKGMNDCWYGPNSTDVVLEHFEDASKILKIRIDLVNITSFKRSIVEFGMQVAVVLFLCTQVSEFIIGTNLA